MDMRGEKAAFPPGAVTAGGVSVPPRNGICLDNAGSSRRSRRVSFTLVSMLTTVTKSLLTGKSEFDARLAQRITRPSSISVVETRFAQRLFSTIVLRLQLRGIRRARSGIVCLSSVEEMVPPSEHVGASPACRVLAGPGAESPT